MIAALALIAPASAAAAPGGSSANPIAIDPSSAFAVTWHTGPIQWAPEWPDYTGGNPHVWFSWTPAVSHWTSVAAISNDFDTEISVYGSYNGGWNQLDPAATLTPPTCSSSYFRFFAAAGATYRISVLAPWDGGPLPSGALQLCGAPSDPPKPKCKKPKKAKHGKKHAKKPQCAKKKHYKKP